MTRRPVVDSRICRTWQNLKSPIDEAAGELVFWPVESAAPDPIDTRLA
jgi:hypothetical protein